MTNFIELDTQSKLKAVQHQLALHNVNDAQTSVQERFGSDVIVIDVQNLSPKTKCSLKVFFGQDAENIEFNHTYCPDLSQKAYSLLRIEKPYEFADLSENFADLNHWDLTNNGRNACSVVQDLLNGEHPFLSTRIWDKSQLVKNFDHHKPVLELDIANTFIQNATLEPLLCLDEIVFLDNEENTLTLSLNAYLVAKHGKYSEIYSRFHADFEIKESNELSVEFVLSNYSVRSEYLYVNAPLKGNTKNLVTDELENYLDQTAVDYLAPTDQHKTVFLEQFKKCMGDVTYKTLCEKYVA